MNEFPPGRPAQDAPQPVQQDAPQPVQHHAVAPTEVQASGDPFAPAGITFQSVSPNLIKVRLITVLGWMGFFILLIVGGCVAASVWGDWHWGWVALAPLLALTGWLLWLIPRQVRAIGYAETHEDLMIRQGIMFRKLTIVPYGRMQDVVVDAGPLDRAFGVAKVQLNTASSDTDAVLPGLPPREAARLRDRLAEAGEAKMAGL